MNDDDSIALSVKRRRLTLHECKTVQYASTNRTYKRKKRILHLPDELLYLIFSKLSLIDIASILSTVCKRFELVAINLMNITFCNIYNKIEKLRANRIEKVTSSKSEDNVIFTYKMLSILDILQDQYTLIKASTWRYAYFQLAPRENYLAIRAGMLLDQFELIFRHLVGSEIILNFMPEIPNTLSILQDLSKEYLDKFEKYACSISENAPDKSGCKIVDLLDCFKGVERIVMAENCENNICNLSIKYTVERAWFTVLILNNASEIHDEMYEDIRFMYKRLRRLVRAHNSVYFEESLTYRKYTDSILIESIHPNFEMYCGYGEMCNKFYFYGTMTEGYMTQRLARGINIPDDNDDNDDDDGNENPILIDIERENVIILPRNHITIPKLTFEINVTCPLYLAPWFVLHKYNTSGDLNMLTAVKAIQSSMDHTILNENNSNILGNFNMNLIITSNTAEENRLPYKYKYNILQTPECITIKGDNIGQIV